MAQRTIELTCPGCGARVSTEQQTCVYCGSPVVITTFNSVYSMPVPAVNKYANTYRQALAGAPDDFALNNSAAMCYLKLGLYDKALAAFERAIEDNFDNSETYFYAAVCLLGGKKAFVCPKATVDKAIEYVNAANMIEPRGIYHYFLAYLKQDYYARKYLRTSPDYTEELRAAAQLGVPQPDIQMLFSVLRVEVPAALRI